MDSVQFLHFLENPFNIEPERVEELKRLLESHPCCQPLAYINSRFLLEQNHPDFEKYSRQAIALAVNRKVFHDYISGKQSPLRPNPIFLKLDLEENKSTGNDGLNLTDGVTSEKHTFPGNQGANFSAQKKSHDHLIEKFIKEEPRISPPGKDLPKENFAEKPIALQQELVTETLAQVYAQQGFLDDAIDILKKLSLKNPEKSSYFAKKIETLKNKSKT